MKDAFGGIVNLVFIVVFLLIVIAVLGLVVSYTKAFRMKNEIISTIEKYEGSGCVTSSPGVINEDSQCIKKIKEKASSLAYSPVITDCPSDDSGNKYYNALNYYCFSTEKDGNYLTVRVMTQVNIELPIIKEIMGFNVFRVSGDTRRIYLNQ